MSATIVASGTKAVPPVVSSVRDIPLERIRESSSNPRRVFDEANSGSWQSTSNPMVSYRQFLCVRRLTVRREHTNW